ncbi:MAG: metallophosphoesterase [Clostridiales Family XIII bacterium]|jgi:predicted MPP superfamily phosphohydrolase|nr:metallophosphoesterase [Clostridiales Family XIII bacterium]
MRMSKKSGSGRIKTLVILFPLVLSLLLAACAGEETVTKAEKSLFGTISSEVPQDAGSDGATVMLFFGDSQPDVSISEYKDFADLVRAAREAAPDADFAMQCGDLTNTGAAPEEWDAFFAAVAPAFEGLPLFLAPGNHEYSGSAGPGEKPETWLSAFALPQNGPDGYKEEYYSFDCGDVHVISLSSNQLDPTETYSADPDEAARIADVIDAWIEADLSETDKPWKIVLMHQPAYPVSGDSTQAQMAARWLPVFERTGVDLVLCGHQHEFMRTWPWRGSVTDGGESEDGIVQIMVNSSAKSYEDSAGVDLPYMAFEMTGARGYARLCATAEKLTSDIMDESGRTLDHWEKPRKKPI